MNRFRANLHPALFEKDKQKEAPEVGVNDGGVETKKALDESKVEVKTTSALDDLLGDIINDSDRFLTEVKNKKVQSVEYSHYGDRREQKKDQMRFTERCNKPSQNANGEIYKNIWDRNNEEGYDLLINTLKDSGYFDDKNEFAEKQKIKEMYLKEVKDQYVKNVWFANDKDFLKVADVLFGKDSPDYPANKIYQKLTGAPTIFNRELQSKESYNPSVVSTRQEGVSTNTEKMKDNKKVDFLSKDFPDYLRSIKGTPKILDRFKWLPFVNAKIDQPSKTDKDAIKKFLNVALKLNYPSGSDPVISLLDALQKGVADKTLRSNTSKEKYREVLIQNGFSVKNENDWKQVEEVCKFYLKTQQDNQSVRDQHAIYLSVLQAIKNAGGIDKAVSTYKDIVDEYKKTKKTEEKEGYAEGKELDKTQEGKNFLNFAKSLGITDFTYATRLFKLDKDYFDKNKETPEVILANLNNNATIDPSDHVMGGSKTGAQFLNIFNTIKNSGGKPMDKLLERAKLVNQVSKLGLDEGVFTEDSIKNGNKQLILLLQDIINKPGQELSTLMSEKETIEGVDLEQQAAYKKAGELVKNIDFAKLQKDGVVLASPTNMQAGLAAVMYDQFKVSSAGIAGSISFDEWAKGLKLDAGCQVGSDGSVVVGIGLRYDNTYNIGKGWTISQGLNAGLFVPIGEKPRAGVGTSAELAKNWFNKNGIYNKLGLKATYDFVGVHVVSAGIEWSRDKSKGIDKAEIEHRMAFKDIMDKALETLMEQIKSEVTESQGTTNEVKLNLSDKEGKVVGKIREILSQKAKELKIPEKDIASTVESTIRLLLPYDGVNIADENIREMISLRVSEEYAMAWSENRKAEIAKKPYLSNLGVGAFWVVGTKFVGAYLNFGFTRHRIDGYGDAHGKDIEYKREGKRLDSELIQKINGRLGLTNENGLKFIPNPTTTTDVAEKAVSGDQSEPEKKDDNLGKDNLNQDEKGGYVQIPSNFLSNLPSSVEVLIDPEMQGLMAKDKDGNILLSPETPIDVDDKLGTSTHSSRLIIGRSKLSDGEKFQNFRTLPGDRSFVDDYKNIPEDKVSELREYDKYDVNILNQLLADLKKRPGNDELANLEWDQQTVENLVDEAQKIADQGKKVKIVLEKDGDNFKTSVKEGGDGRGLEIEYGQPFDMMDEKAQKIASEVYQEALKLSNPIKLYNVKHDINKKTPHRKDYDEFIKALDGGNYDSAKTIIGKIFEKLDTQNKKIRQLSNFKGIGEKLQNLKGESLVQALMSINNIFARANSVKGNGSEYSFRRWEKGKELEKGIGDIIASRENQILKTVKTSPKIDKPEVRDAYVSLIEASKQYRESHKEEFNKKTVKAAELKNTVGFNLGDKNNPENPLFNPEIYEIGKDGKDVLSGFDPKKKEILHEHAMRLFAENPHLIGPILEKLGFKDQKPTNTKFEMVGETGKLILEFGEGENKKIVEITADMAFGYFTQCVNHTVILNNLSAVGPDGTTIRNGVLSQSSTEYSVSSNFSSTHLGFTVGGGGDLGKGGGASTQQETYIEGPTGNTPIGGSGSGSGGSGGGMVDE